MKDVTVFFCEKRTVFSTVVNSDSLDIIHTHTHTLSIPTCLFFSIVIFFFSSCSLL